MVPIILRCIIHGLILRIISAQTTDGCPTDTNFDYIVVGTGASGSVVINRLSEDSNTRVMGLEAGGYYSHISDIPLYAPKLLHTEVDWNYTTVPQKDCCEVYNNNIIQFSRGKCLGGTASLNWMAYTRCSKRDYDTWADLGNGGWSSVELENYFLKVEDYRIPIPNPIDESYHHVGGPLIVEEPSFKTLLSYAFLDGGQELGYPLVDYNAKDQIGFMYPPVTLHNGSRYNAFRAYLEPAMKRSNVHVEIYALATKILFDGSKRATGVEFRKGTSTCQAFASKEVIISAGAINSPQLLMLSGIGPKETLDKYGINVVSELPGVGQNLQDHVGVGAQTFTLNDSVSLNSKRYQTPEYEQLWETNRTGPLVVPTGFEGIAFLNTGVTDSPSEWPDLEFYFTTTNIVSYFKAYLKLFVQLLIPGDSAEVMSFVPILLRPKSKGYVTLQSADPLVSPLIDPKYLSHPEDARTLAEGLKIIQNLIKTNAFQKYGAELINLGIQFPSCTLLKPLNQTAYYICLAKAMSTNGYHPSSTCKMGPSTDSMAVVDSRLRVRGVDKLRVADASVMPNIVAGHPQVACTVIGEKVSDMIKEDAK